jgi:hypothetical protein
MGVGLADLLAEGHGAQADRADLQVAAAKGQGVHRGGPFGQGKSASLPQRASRPCWFLFDGHFLLFYSKFMHNKNLTLPRRPSLSLALRLGPLAVGVRALALLAALVLLAVLPLQLISPDTLPALGLGEPGQGLMNLVEGELTMAGRWRVAAVTAFPVGLGLALLWQLWRLFGEYRRGAVFSPRALACLQRFSLLLVALAIVQPLAQAALSVALTWDNPPGHRALVVSVGSNDYALLLGSLVFVAIARVMREAARAAEENEGFV